MSVWWIAVAYGMVSTLVWLKIRAIARKRPDIREYLPWWREAFLVVFWWIVPLELWRQSRSRRTSIIRMYIILRDEFGFNDRQARRILKAGLGDDEFDFAEYLTKNHPMF